QALKYDRLIGIEFDTACLLNISPDHISSIEHKDFDDYLESKLKIFGKAKRVLINLDLPYLSIIQDNLQLDQTITFFSQKNSNADYFLEYFSYSENEIRVKIKTPSDSISCQAQLTGQFNAINILAALAIADMFKVDKKSIQAGISVTEVPGRMEILETNDQNILTLVDFAHNKLSFKKVFEFAEDLYSDYYKIAVFGSVGNKAKNRRYELGLVAGQYADLCILTCDNNDLEDQKNINIEIAQGIEINNGSWQEIEDRRAAIQESFDIANQHFQKTRQKVILLILGRGPEDSMRINGKDVPYLSDGEITQACISTYNKSINDLSKKKYF
ncbi:MAG TPA: Mur ligase family protein, partial [Candidatus Eisenbacteria bacterium]|nr:Mur ligase family protein [Candidatus Eisenbacteria bacterium]